MKQHNDFINIIELKRRLYQRYKDFKKFTSLDDEKIQSLKLDTFYLKEKYTGRELYANMLQYLIYQAATNYSFDDKMFCLIEACDPNLEFLRTFVAFGRPSVGTVEYEQYLNKAYALTGFRDEHIRKFEQAYAKNVILKNNKDQKTLSRTNIIK